MTARPLSLRLLVLVPVLSTILVGFLGFSIYLDRTTQANRIDDIDEELERAHLSADQRPPVAAGQPTPGVGGGNQVPAVFDSVDDLEVPTQLLVSDSGEVLARIGGDNPFDTASLLAVAAVDPGPDGVLFSDERSNRRVLVTAARGDDRQVTALSLEPVDADASEFRRALVAGGLLIAALVTGVVWLVTMVVTRPVARLSETASLIADGELEASAKTVTGSREVIELGANFDQMVSRLQAARSTSEQSAAEALVARDDMRRFLADVSHELRTPLTALKGYADLYAVGALETTEDVDRAMSRIGSESDRLTSLTTEMLALAREVPSDEMTVEFDVDTVVAGVVDDVRAARPTQLVASDLACGLSVVGAPGRVHQVVLNLATNACEHGASDKGISIRSRQVGSNIEVSVVDHGPGVADEDQSRIFLPLYQAESSRSRQGVGSAGLGLAVCKQIAEDHDGMVTVSQTKGGGATFTLRLPMAQTSEE